jgi:hypothetical protein
MQAKFVDWAANRKKKEKQKTYQHPYVYDMCIQNCPDWHQELTKTFPNMEEKEIPPKNPFNIFLVLKKLIIAERKIVFERRHLLQSSLFRGQSNFVIFKK